jgi:hypothetical protein
MHEVPSHYILVGVWCALSENGIVGSIFSKSKNSHTYILTLYVQHLFHKRKCVLLCSKTVHYITQHTVLKHCLESVCGDIIIIMMIIIIITTTELCFITNLTFRGTCIVTYSYNKSQRDAVFLKIILMKNSTCFRQIYCPSSEVSTLYTQQ